MEQENVIDEGRSIYPVKYIQTLTGETAHVILFSDGNQYVVKWKFANNNKRAHEVTNEYVVGKLANLLSLPVVPFQLVYIPEDFIKSTPELHSPLFHYEAGYHYGCLYIDNSIVFDDVWKSPPTRSEVENYNMAAGMMVFDQWVNNTNRSKPNLLLERLSDGGYRFYMIDQGCCFPGEYEWTALTLEQQPEYKFDSQVYRWGFSLLDDDGSKELASFVEKITALPNESIADIIQSIPKEWNVSEEDRHALYNFLIKHKHALPKVIAGMMEFNRNDKYSKKEKEKKEFTGRRAQFTELIRKVADQFDAGTVAVYDRTVTLPDHEMEYKIAYELESGVNEFKITVKSKWIDGDA